MRPAPESAVLVAGDEQQLSRTAVLDVWFGVAILAMTAVGFFLLRMPHRPVLAPGWEQRYVQVFLRLHLMLIGILVGVFFAEPVLTNAVRRWARRSGPAYTFGALACACVFLCVFVIHEGRWQFGGFDYSIIVETGWRQIQGQRPYVDFPTTAPPGFNLPIKYAYETFGVNWNATTYLAAIFSCLTFLWTYWLMTKLSLTRPAAIAMSFAMQCAAMLTLCFWWYNNTVLILAAVFFLSCLLYEKQSESVPVQASYFASLVLLSLMKPNIAGVMILGGVALLLLVSGARLRLIVLTAAAAIFAVLFLAVNHVSIPAMISSYVSVAKERGTVSVGFEERPLLEKILSLCWVAVVSLPTAGASLRMPQRIGQRKWKLFAYDLFFPLALLVAFYGLMTNGEFRDVECTILLAAGAVLVFGLRSDVRVRRAFIAIVCASIVTDLYYGSLRVRVYAIGPGEFFQWQDNQHRVEEGFLKDMRIGSAMVELEREVRLAEDGNPGPYFFGPRIDFNYAVLGLPSPEHFPAWWHPGTSFAASEQSRTIDTWKKNEFQTLIFMKGEFPYYSPEFLDAIHQEYVEDRTYPSLTVYHRRTSHPSSADQSTGESVNTQTR